MYFLFNEKTKKKSFEAFPKGQVLFFELKRPKGTCTYFERSHCFSTGPGCPRIQNDTASTMNVGWQIQATAIGGGTKLSYSIPKKQTYLVGRTCSSVFKQKGYVSGKVKHCAHPRHKITMLTAQQGSSDGLLMQPGGVDLTCGEGIQHPALQSQIDVGKRASGNFVYQGIKQEQETVSIDKPENGIIAARHNILKLCECT